MVLKSKSVLSGSKQMVRSRSSDNLPTSQSQVNVQMMSHTLTIREVSTPEPSEVVEVQYFPHRFFSSFSVPWLRFTDTDIGLPVAGALFRIITFSLYWKTSPMAAPAAMSCPIIFLPDSSPAGGRAINPSFSSSSGFVQKKSCIFSLILFSVVLSHTRNLGYMCLRFRRNFSPRSPELYNDANEHYLEVDE